MLAVAEADVLEDDLAVDLGRGSPPRSRPVRSPRACSARMRSAPAMPSWTSEKVKIEMKAGKRSSAHQPHEGDEPADASAGPG